jgi:long-chain acyl-CoA synthetase
MAPMVSNGSLKTAIVQPGMFKQGPFSLEVPGSKHVEGETLPRRNAQFVDKLVTTPEEGVNTIYDILCLAGERFSDLDAMGWRTLIETHQEVKLVKKVVAGKETTVEKKWTFFEMSDFKYLSFRQYMNLAMSLGSGLRHLGLEKNDRLHIYAATRYVTPAPLFFCNLATECYQQCTLVSDVPW